MVNIHCKMAFIRQINELSYFTVPYVVGVNPNSPKNPHSALASGGFDVGKIDTDPAQEAHVLYGAMVGGPDKRGRFFDVRSDWPETEVSNTGFR